MNTENKMSVYAEPDLSKYALDDHEKAVFLDGHRVGWKAARAAFNAAKAEAPMTYDEFFAEARRLKCKLPDDVCAELAAAPDLAAQQAAAPGALPERDPTKPAEQQGLFRKFEVRRTDGSDQPGGKHYGCRHYVIDLDHDPAAPATMRTYAAEVRSTHPLLAADIEAEFGAAPSAPGTPEAPALRHKSCDAIGCATCGYTGRAQLDGGQGEGAGHVD